MPARRPYVSVIVPHYNQPAALRRCLECLAAQDFDGAFEIIVGDNNSPGGIEGLHREFPEVRFVTACERGAAPARNAAIAAAQGEVLAFTDSDCLPAPDWLREGVAALVRGDGDLIAGDVDVTCRNESAPTDVECFERVFGFRQEMYVRRKGFSVTANIMTTAETARQIGSFTNGLSEDLDWCHRARALGFRLAFHGKSRVSHPARADWSALTLKWDRLIRERWQGDQAKGHARWIVMALLTALSAVPHSAVVMVSPRLETMGQRLAAIKVLFRIRFWRCREMMARGQSGEKIGGGNVVEAE